MLCNLTKMSDPALRLNGIWALMNMAFQVKRLLYLQYFYMRLMKGRRNSVERISSCKQACLLIAGIHVLIIRKRIMANENLALKKIEDNIL